MHSTGRLADSLPPHLRRRLYGAAIGDRHLEDLRIQADVDRASVVMLLSRGLCDRAAACGLLCAINALLAEDFGPLLGLEIPRGLYLEVERYLAGRPGGGLAAELQRGRSRNDITATATKIKMRIPLLNVMAGILRLAAACRRRAQDDTTMTLHTHLQPAQPGSCGFYFAGVAGELLDDFDRFLALWPVLQQCPLGAGAIAGTALPIDEPFLARLLGFDTPVDNALRAVASRGYVLDALGAASIAGTTLCRVATDMLFWVSEENGIARLPDCLVGSSSHLPQKRNPFLLEHVQGRSGRATGAFVSASAALMGRPFTNSVAVNTEAVRPVWEALADLDDCLVFMRECTAGIVFNPDAMNRQARSNACMASNLAELARGKAGSFRQAHHDVGTLATIAEKSGRPFMAVATEWALEHGLIRSGFELEPANLVAGRNYGGGPGQASMARQRTQLDLRWHESFERWRSIRRGYRESASQLEAIVSELVSQSRCP